MLNSWFPQIHPPILLPVVLDFPFSVWRGLKIGSVVVVGSFGGFTSVFGSTFGTSLVSSLAVSTSTWADVPGIGVPTPDGAEACDIARDLIEMLSADCFRCELSSIGSVDAGRLSPSSMIGEYGRMAAVWSSNSRNPEPSDFVGCSSCCSCFSPAVKPIERYEVNLY